MQVLREDAKERPTAAESLRHPWLHQHNAKQQASEKKDMALSPSAGSPSLRIRTPGVGTFTSPSHSLSPAMATWKIPARAGGDSILHHGTLPPRTLSFSIELSRLQDYSKDSESTC